PPAASKSRESPAPEIDDPVPVEAARAAEASAPPAAEPLREAMGGDMDGRLVVDATPLARPKPPLPPALHARSPTIESNIEFYAAAGVAEADAGSRGDNHSRTSEVSADWPEDASDGEAMAPVVWSEMESSHSAPLLRIIEDLKTASAEGREEEAVRQALPRLIRLAEAALARERAANSVLALAMAASLRRLGDMTSDPMADIPSLAMIQDWMDHHLRTCGPAERLREAPTRAPAPGQQPRVMSQEEVLKALLVR
ncbi:MAG: hypothetical protein HQL39_13905, partial [Alphaproteobacteria bacterium]|nr:hypothetical protein [Alphaproteobacteria bacterium]